MTPRQRLAAFVDTHHLGDDALTERLMRYVELLLQFNTRMNLIGPLDEGQVVRELIIDSLIPGVLDPPRGRACDVGSGAGIPGIPLAAAFPEAQFTLVEPRRRRAEFIRIASNRLQLEVEVVHARVEEAALGPHDWLISKAFRPPIDWLDCASELMGDDARIICIHAASASAELRAHAASRGLAERQHVPDIAGRFGIDLPEQRAVTSFGPLAADSVI